MGINNLHTFLKKKAPHVYRQVHLSEYVGKRVAVDISGLIYKYKVLNKDRWLDSFAYLVLALRRNHVHPIFVFEGVAPKEKEEEKTKRSNQRNAIKDKAFTLRESLDHYYQTQEIKEDLVQEMKKIEKAPSLGVAIPINTSALEKRYAQIEAQIVHFTDEENDNLLRLFDLTGVQYITSPVEAETLCASLALEGKVDGVVSNDSDVMAYGVTKFLYEINGLNETCVEIDHNEVLKALNFTHAQFLDFCIMCGCDYNDNIAGIGPVNAYRLISLHKRIEDLPSKLDSSVLRYIRTRELFSTKVPFEADVLSSPPESLHELYNFLKMRNSRIQYKTIEKAFEPIEIVLEDT